MKNTEHLTNAIAALRTAYAEYESSTIKVETFVSAMESKFSTYSNVTLERIQHHPWSKEAANTVATYFPNEWEETTINDYMAVAVALNLIEGESLHIIQVDSWRLYPDLHPPNNGGDYPRERLSQIIALHRVTQHMEHVANFDPYWMNEQTGELAPYLTIDSIREFIMHPEEPYTREDIVEVITTNNVYDVDLIKQQLNSDARSLSSGIL